MSRHLNDIVSIPASGLEGVSEVNLSISCELIENQLQAAPIDPRGDIQVVQDATGSPLVFTIGSDGHFRLLAFAQGTRQGYTGFELGGSLEGYDKALAFAVTQDRQGRISIAVAMERSGGTATDVFLASMLSHAPGAVDWTRFSAVAKKLTGVDDGFVADHIQLGTTDDGEPPLLLMAGSLQGNEVSYQSTDGASAARMALPEDVHSPTRVELGFAFGQRGTFFLYSLGDSQTLECTTLADSFEGAETYDFSPGNPELPEAYRNLQYTCMATTAGSNTNPMTLSSDLYVGTTRGVVLFRGCDIQNGGFQVVTDAIQDVHQLYITEDADSISVWALSSPARLYYIHGKKGATYQWNSPILFNATTLQVAPIRSQGRKANELYLVDQDNSLLHFWQDPQSTLWRQETLNVKGEDYLIDFKSYTTQICLADQNGQRLGGQKVRLTSSEWQFATINGRVYSLDLDNPAEVETDNLGGINIIQAAHDIAPPILHLDADCLTKVVNIHPNGRILQGLQGLQSGSDLKNATDQNGKPVVTKDLPDSTFEGVASNVSQLNTAAAGYTQGALGPTRMFVILSDKGTRNTGRLSVAHLPADFAIGLRLEKGVWKPYAPDARGAAPAGDFIGELEDFVGDAFQFLENAFEEGIKLIDKDVTYLEDGVSFVVRKVDDVLHFVLTLQDKILTIVLDTLVTVLKALNWILGLVGIDLTAILRWLGHLLGWDDIWDTHKVIAKLLENGLSYGVQRLDAGLGELKGWLTQTFDTAESKILAVTLPPGIGSQRLGQKSSLDNPLSSSAGSWILSKLLHLGLLDGRADSLPDNSPFMQFVDGVLWPTLNAIATELEALLEELAQVLEGDIQAVWKLLPDIVKLVLEPLRTIMLGLVDLLGGLVGDLRSGVGGDLDIPFLGAIYEFLTTLFGDEEELTVANAVALIVAVPYTFVYKHLRGSAPFAHDDYGMKDDGYYAQIFDGLSAPNLAARGMSRDEGYSRIGGSIAACASIPASILTLLSLAGDEDDNEVELKVMDKLSLGFSVVVCALSFPVKADETNHDAWALKVTAWVVSVIKNLFFKLIRNAKAQAIAAAAVDLLILALALPADGLNHEAGWTWAFDTLSDAGGAVADGGIVFKDSDVGLITTGIGGFIAYIGAILGLISAIEADGVVHVVNPAG